MSAARMAANRRSTRSPAMAPYRALPSLLHDLLLRGLGEVVEFELDLRGRRILALGREVGGHLVDDVAVAAVEFRVDHLARIGVGGLPAQPHALGRPQPEQPVAARLDLELQLLVVFVAGLEIPLAFVEGCHAPGSSCRPAEARPDHSTAAASRANGGVNW